MKRVVCIGFALAIVAATMLAGGERTSAQVAPPTGFTPARALLDSYCVGCHSSAVRAGGLAFDTLSVDAVHEHPDIWEAAVRKLRGRLMPPPGSRQPEQREIDAFVTWMEATLDRTAGGRVAGSVPMQRMTRTEYGTAVNDLL